MTKACILGILFVIGCAFPAGSQETFEKDPVEMSAGKLEITFIGHGTLILAFDGKIIHVDPYGHLADYSKLPKADIVLITHEHGDHLDPAALAQVRTEKTRLVYTEKCAAQVKGGTIMKNGDVQTIEGILIEAVPAYNRVHRRDNGQPYHPQGDGNGYVLTFGDKRIYIAGDTENIPEMKALTGIDFAFLPMNLPYTMTPEMAADAARAFRPKVLYPYHYGETDVYRIMELLKDSPNIEVRIRRMK